MFRVRLVPLILLLGATALIAPIAAQERQIISVGGAGQDVRIVAETAIAGMAAGRLSPMALGTGVIVGQAVDAAGKQPIASALVTLTLPGAQPIRALADGEGRFAFRDLPKGSFTMTVSKPGYVDGAYGRLRPSGPSRSLVLEDGGREVAAVIPMWKYAAVTGRIVDEHGEPAIGTLVRALQKTTVAGLQKLTPGATDYTDDRGEFRMGMLEPGDYVIAVPMTQALGPREVETIVAGAATFTASISAPGVDALVSSVGGGGGAPAGVGADGRPLAYLTQFYPAALDSTRATVLQVQSGEERSGIDFQLRPSRTQRLSGRVMGPNGPEARTMLTLVPAEADDLASPIETATTISDAAGEFTFSQVPPGSYSVQVVRTPQFTMREGPVGRAGGGGVMVARTIETFNAISPAASAEPTLWADVPVIVGESDVNDAVVMLRPGMRIRGKVEFSGAATPPAADALPAISVILDPANGRSRVQMSLRGRIEPNGTFTSASAPPGKYFLRVVGAPAGWTFRGAMLGGRDIADEPIELTSADISGIVLSFTDQPAELSGSVSNGGQRDESATVLVFPTDRDGWANYGASPRRLRSVRVDKTGNYSINALPAGDYYVIAVPETSASDWQNPRALETLATRARRVQIGEGQKATQSLEVVR